MKITRNFKNFDYCNFEANFLKNANHFQKTGVPLFHTKLLCQKPILRQIEWRVQNRPIAKERSFASNYFIF